MSPRIIVGSRGKSDGVPTRPRASQDEQDGAVDPSEDVGDPQTDVGWFGNDVEEDDKPTVVIRAGAEIEALWSEFSASPGKPSEPASQQPSECTQDPITLSESSRTSGAWGALPEDTWMGIAAASLGLAIALLLATSLL